MIKVKPMTIQEYGDYIHNYFSLNNINISSSSFLFWLKKQGYPLLNNNSIKEYINMYRQEIA